MKSIIEDNEVWRIASLIVTCIISFLPLAITVKRPGIGRFLNVVYILSLTILLFCWRAPAIFLNTEINVDESQTIAQAICYSNDPFPWRSVDANTSGPVNTYIYMWPYLLDMHVSYTTLRLTSMVLILAALSSLFFIAQKFIGARYAASTILPCIIYILHAAGPDYAHASTEWPSIAFTTFAMLLGVNIWQGMGNCRSCLLAGALLGLVPLAKLQCVPTAGLLGLALCARFVWTQPEKWKWQLLSLISGAIAPLAIMTALVAKANALDEMWLRYVVRNIGYQGDLANLNSIQRVQALLSNNPGLTIYLGWVTGTVAATLPILLAGRKKFKNQIIIATILASSIIATTFSIIKPGYNFPHYLTIIVIPASICAILALAFLRDTNPSAILPCIAGGVASIGLYTWIFPNQIQAYIVAAQSSADFRDPLSKFISEQIQEGDTLGIWGWTPRYFAESQTRSATRDTVSYFLLVESPHRSRFRDTYLNDIMKSKPKIFVDTATDITNDSRFPPIDFRRHNSFSKLNEYIGENYDKVGEMTPQNHKFPFWIYMRKPN